MPHAQVHGWRCKLASSCVVLRSTHVLLITLITLVTLMSFDEAEQVSSSTRSASILLSAIISPVNSDCVGALDRTREDRKVP